MSNAASVALPSALTKVVEIMNNLASDERLRLIETISTFYKDDLDTPSLGAHVPRPRTIVEDRMPTPSAPVPYLSTEDAPSPKDFMLAKDPQTDVERVACLAYYLQKFRGMNQFKTLDLSKLNMEAAQPKFANAANAATNALAGNYLAVANKGHRQLSAPGERFVAALPHRDEAKATMKTKTSRRRKKSGIKGRNKSEKSAKPTPRAA